MENNLEYNFEWDPRKAKINIKKHKVAFIQASTVFKDPKALTVYDVEHGDTEERWLTLGFSSTGSLLVVHHTFTEIDKEIVLIRIISSRKATKKEQNYYNDKR